MDDRELLKKVEQASKRVKLFPLPEVALFPSHGLPLHVFEPRYRELTRDALAGDGVLALPQLRRPQLAFRDGPPELNKVFGIGVVAEHQELPDGKWNMVVRGVARAKLVRELMSDHSYREAELEILSEDDAGVTADDGSALASLLMELGRRLSPETQVALGQLAALQPNPGRLADLSAAALLSAGQCQKVLAELQVKRRLSFVTEQVAELLLTTRPTDGTLLN